MKHKSHLPQLQLDRTEFQLAASAIVAVPVLRRDHTPLNSVSRRDAFLLEVSSKDNQCVAAGLRPRANYLESAVVVVT